MVYQAEPHLRPREAITDMEWVANGSREELGRELARRHPMSLGGSGIGERVRERFPGCVVHFDAPLSPRNTWAGARLAFGEVVETLVDFDVADLVLTLDANVLASGPSALRSARQVARRAMAKAALVHLFFMGLRRERASIVYALASAAILLGILLTLVLTDVLLRPVVAGP